jgi:O-antigen ligase
LSFPVTYTNALGLLAVLGIVPCVHFCSDVREPPISRVASAAGLPVLASTLYFTFSRGAIVTSVIVVVAYLLIGRPRGTISLLIAAAPATAIALAFAYNAGLLATVHPTTPAATTQGHRVAVAIAACIAGAAVLRALLLPLDTQLARLALPAGMRTRIVRGAWGALVVAVVVAAVALSGTIAHQYQRFVHTTVRSADLRARLTDPGSANRIGYWKVAWHQFTAAPVLGKGAGTFANTWAQNGRTGEFVLDAHSLYMETLDELGIVGFVLLLTAIVAILVAAATRCRGPDRPLYAALFAALLAWAIHAGVDWDWEMPVLTVVFFALGGIALSAPWAGSAESREAAGPTLVPYPRVLIGLGCLLLAVAPTYVWLSQRKLDAARSAFAHGQCAAATHDAMDSISIVAIRPEPYEILSYCDARRGLPGLSVAAIQRALALDPHNWNYWYSLAVMRAAAGLDPRGAAREALVLDPLEPLTQDAWQTFSSGGRRHWEHQGMAIANQFSTL